MADISTMDDNLILTEVFNKFGENIPAEISSALKEILDKNLKDTDFVKDMEEKDSIETIVFDYISQVAPTLQELSKQIAEILTSKIQTEYNARKQS